MKRSRAVDRYSLILSGDYYISNQAYFSFASLMAIGEVKFNNVRAKEIDEQTLNSSGYFSKFNFDSYFRYRVTNRTYVDFSLDAQFSNKNLDSSEKMVLGGPNSIRSLDIGAYSGDSGYRASISINNQLFNNGYGVLFASAFYDVGYLKFSNNPWSSGRNSVTVQGAGLGLDWYYPGGLSFTAQVAKDVKNTEKNNVSLKGPAFWLKAKKSF